MTDRGDEFAGIDEARLDLQVRLEARMASIGSQAFRRKEQKAREKGRIADLPAGLAMLRRAVGPLVDAVDKMLKAAVEEGRPGWLNLAVPKLRCLGSDVVALITAKTILNAAVEENTMTRLAKRLGSALHREARVTAFARQYPDIFGPVWEQQHRHSKIGAGHRAKVFLAISRRHPLQFDPWTNREELEIGLRLIAMFAETTGWITITTVRRGKRLTRVVYLSPEAEAWTEKLHRHVELMTCERLPCVVPPRDWSTPHDGGYLTSAVPPLTIVKTRRKAHIKALEQAVMPSVYHTINALQRTAWKINERVLRVAEALWEGGEATAGLPSREPPPIPEKPVDIDTNVEARKAWRRAAAVAHEDRIVLLGKRLHIAKTLAYAREFLQYGHHYYVYQCDFRGRLYAVSAYLNPQGEDLTRGLLTFAEGLPIEDEAAAEWLMIHAANCYGVDKVSFAERIKWVQDHRDLIVACADDPLAERWWVTADQPFQFLAACFELAGFWRTGFGFVSHLPVSMDGSNNGLQHYAALLRDQETAEAVNLVPSDKPQDIYSRVAEAALEHLKVLAATEPAAVPWVTSGWMDRKVAKRPTMVLPYGGTFASCRDYVDDAVREKEAATGETPFGVGEARRRTVLVGAQAVWKALGSVVVAARVGMSFIQSVARVAAKANRPLRWTAPSGFPVWHEYREMKKKGRIRTLLFGHLISTFPVEEGDTISESEQALAAAPNFIHALDAAALVFTVVEGTAGGITSWSMIHDSYGTHAAKAQRLAACLRLAFYDLYKDRNHLAEWREEVASTLPTEYAARLKAAPKLGTYDVSEVLNAPYFFA